MNKKLIRLTESDLHRIVKESVNRLLNERYFDIRNYRRGKMGSKLNKPLSDIDKEKVDVARLEKDIFPDHTPQTAKDFMLRKLYGESNLHRIVKESVNKILKEGYNQFSDSDFGSDGDPYGFFDDEELEDNLNGYYGSFNHIRVKIMNDGKPNAYIMVGSKMDNQKQAFEGEEAQRILDKIRYDADNTYGSVGTAIYRNLYKYVL